jgi:predicted PurR-regulated permease PerM
VSALDAVSVPGALGPESSLGALGGASVSAAAPPSWPPGASSPAVPSAELWSASRGLQRAGSLIALILVIACLYWAQAVAIPVAIAVLLSALLGPIVGGLRRVGLGKVSAVVVTVVLTAALLGALGWGVIRQLDALVDELPQYRQNIRQRIAHFRAAQQTTFFGKAQETAREMARTITPPPPASERPMHVVVDPTPALAARLPSALQTLASVGLVTALVVFMLLRRDELRSRIIRVVGYSRLTLTLRAIEDASQRISRYLLTQAVVNAGFGVVVGLGLGLIGVPYAVLWGVLAALLRFIPYAGAWIAGLMPVALALAVFDDWQRPLMVAALFVLLEPLIYFVIEPVLYAQSTGVSEVALLVALAFWAWLWGPVGLLLGTPLTVCLVVVAKHVRELEFLGVLMSDEPALPGVAFYQRVLASDPAGAERVAGEFLETQPAEQLYDDVLLPSLALARRDRLRHHLADEEVRAIVEAIRETLDRLPATPAEGAAAGDVVLLAPARDDVDEAALEMLARLLLAGGIRAATVPPPAQHRVVGQVGRVESDRPRLVCIGSVVPGGVAQARALCRAIRAGAPEMPIAVGLWGDPDASTAHRALLVAAGATAVAGSVLEARDQVARLLGAASPARADAVVSSATDAAPLTGLRQGGRDRDGLNASA